MIPENPYPKDTLEYYKWELERQGFNQAQIQKILSMDQSEQPDPTRFTQQNNENLLLTV